MRTLTLDTSVIITSDIQVALDNFNNALTKHENEYNKDDVSEQYIDRCTSALSRFDMNDLRNGGKLNRATNGFFDPACLNYREIYALAKTLGKEEAELTKALLNK